MPKIDFQHFKMFVDIAQEKTIEQDMRKEFADIMYKNIPGIVAHDLALRIYRSTEPIEITQEEFDILQSFVSNGFMPIFIDSFRANIKE